MVQSLSNIANEENMNKIVLQIGLLIFALSLIYFGQRNMEFIDVILKSFVMFIFSTFAVALITILFMKSINNASMKKNASIAKNLKGK